MKKIYAILTGDIMHSRKVDATKWLPVLEKSLQKHSEKFDIFRGDSFQALIPIEKSLEAMFYIKASMKSLYLLDVRIGLGIGTIDYQDEILTKSAGEAFIYSGEIFDGLDKKHLAVKSNWSDWDIPTNIMLDLSTELLNRWTVNMAETVVAMMEFPEINQQEIAKRLGRKFQSQISTELSKANWNKIKTMLDYCTNQLINRC